MGINVALDGPSGAGKSTIAKAVAKKLKYVYVDTGAMYRSIAYYVISNGCNPENADEYVDKLSDIKVELCYVDDVQHIVLNGEDVSDKIRTPEISMGASRVSAVPEVRAHLLGMQKEIAEKNNIIMDGRDIGTVVLPDAQIKIFLTASPEERALRRYKELEQKGTDTTFDEVLKDVKQRDYNDSHRAVAPLKPSEDGVTVDTTGMTLEESRDTIIKIIREKIK